MKGFTEVDRVDLLSAIIGFELRYDEAKSIRDKGIKLYYEKHYTNGSWWSRLGNGKKTPDEFARSRIPTFHSWADILHEVLNKKEVNEVQWWCWTVKSKVDPLKALYKASSDKVLINEEMAQFVNEYKDYLENAK